MEISLGEIAKFVNGDLLGDSEIVIRGVNGIREAKEGDITFLSNPKYEPLIETTKASAIITSYDIKKCPRPIIRTENPSLAFAKVISYLFPEEKRLPKGIHPTAVIGKGVQLDENVAVGPCAVLEDGCYVGSNTVICAGVFVGYNAIIGSDCLIYPNVTIREKVRVGNRVIIHSNTVIGSDGFGFEEHNGTYFKVPQVGIVVIEDDVEIGACVAIDRARFGKTLIGRGTKIDNLVQIAHNVVIGENSIIVAQAGISGSSILGKRVILAGQSGVVGHIELGDNVIVGAQAGVTKSVPANKFVVGSPAREHNESKKIFASWNKLPKLLKDVTEIKERLKRLEDKRKKRANK